MTATAWFKASTRWHADDGHGRSLCGRFATPEGDPSAVVMVAGGRQCAGCARAQVELEQQAEQAERHERQIAAYVEAHGHEPQTALDLAAERIAARTPGERQALDAMVDAARDDRRRRRAAEAPTRASDDASPAEPELDGWVVTGPALLDEVPETTYHAGGVRTPGPQTSQSALKRLIPPSTPAEFQWRLLHPEGPKRAFDVGSAAHSLVLGRGAQWVRHPDEEDGYLNSVGAWNSTRKSKEWIQQTRDAGRTPLRAEDYESLYRMADAILAHPHAAELVTDPARRPEVSAYAEVTPGLWLRGRFDLLGGGLVDFKTAAQPRPDRFRESVWEYGYHVQDAAYRRLWALAAGADDPGPMTFIVVGKEPPHLVSVCALDPEFERFGVELLDAAIATYLEQHAKHGDPRDPDVTWDGLPHETAVLSPPRRAYYDAEGVDYTPAFPEL